MPETQNTLSLNIDQTTLGVGHADGNGQWIWVNDKLCEVLGYTKDELISSDIHSVVSNPSEGPKESNVEFLTFDRSSQAYEVDCKTKNGQAMRAKMTISHVDPTGDNAGYFVLLLEDIQPIKLAEEKLRLAASVFSHTHEAILITDRNERILDINPAFSEVTGYTNDMVVGKTPRVLSSGRHDAEFFNQLWREVNEQGYWKGEIWNRKLNGSYYISRCTITAVYDEYHQISHYIGVFTDITAIRFQRENMEHLAQYDTLTQLPNRTLLSDRLDQALALAKRKQSLLAICFIDLDEFKSINDRLGQDKGDKLLIEVAKRLKRNLRAGDTVSRIGGDEFVLLLSRFSDRNEVNLGTQRFISIFDKPFNVDQEIVRITASMGVVIHPDDDSDAETLLRHADQAMYKAKLAGRNQYQFHDPIEDHLHTARSELLHNINLAIQRDEFEMFYQPKVNLRQGRVIGMEALIRWRHPTEGLLTPKFFLHALRGKSLSVELDFWVLRNVMKQLIEWESQGLYNHVSVNLSGETLLAPNFINRLTELAHDNPSLSDGRLQLEVLETAALEDLAKAEHIFHQCIQLGFKIALDDFGTGYSSLTYFRRLPASILKIDQSFVRDMLYDPNDMAIVQSIIGLAQAFNRQVISEGVENPMVAALLISLGCENAQGDSIASAMPADLIPQWISSFEPDPQWLNPIDDSGMTDDVPIALIGLEHKRWVERVESWLRSEPNTIKPELDSKRCRLGRWYLGGGKKEYGHYAEYAHIEPVHDQVHALAEEMLNLHSHGDTEAALAQIPLLHRLRERLLARIDDLWRVVAINQEQSKKSPDKPT